MPATAAPVVTVDPPPAGSILIEAVTVNGSSCRPGTVATAISPDGAAFTVTYSEYIAQAGGDATPGAQRQKCKLTVRVRVPSGVTYAISQVDYRGFAELATGASAFQRASHQFQGDPPSGYVDHRFTGPLSDVWQATDRVDGSALIYAPCGKERKITIDTELSVEPGTSEPDAHSVFGMDSTDGSVASTYHFAWRTCPS